MAKCLVNRSKAKIMPDGSFLLDRLLDVKNESNRTALLVACNLKNSPLIELLAEAGANCKALDKQGNTAILLAAISRAVEEDPTDDLSPSIFKVYFSLYKTYTYLSKYQDLIHFKGLPKYHKRF